MEKERRTFKIEVRQADNGVKLLAGTPIVYNRKSEDMGFFEYIAAGAAKEAIRASDPRLLYGHNSDVLLPIARKKSGTLREVEDKNGVHIEADPPQKNQFVDALIESIERGDVGEMSFGFTVLDDEWKNLDTDKPTRTIIKIGEIFDYSYVAFAAYNDTTVALRSLDAAKGATSDTEGEKINDIVRNILSNDDESISIIIRDKKNDEVNVFTGEFRFDNAVKEINNLNPDPSGNDKDNLSIAKDLANQAQDEQINLDIDTLILERTTRGFKR